MKHNACKLLILLAVGFAFNASGCKSVGEQIENSSMSNLEQQTEPSDLGIRQMFIQSGLGEGDEFLVELGKIQRERVVTIVREIREAGIREGDENFGAPNADLFLKMKAAYYLITLDVDVKSNESLLLDNTKSKDAEIKAEALSYLANLVDRGKYEYLPIFFAAAARSDNHDAEELAYLFADHVKRSPDQFLKYLAREPKPTRMAVYELLSGAGAVEGEDAVNEIRAKVGPLIENAELKAIAAEFLANVRPPKQSP